jgi:hypothetical protein
LEIHHAATAVVCYGFIRFQVDPEGFKTPICRGKTFSWVLIILIIALLPAVSKAGQTVDLNDLSNDCGVVRCHNTCPFCISPLAVSLAPQYPDVSFLHVKKQILHLEDGCPGFDMVRRYYRTWQRRHGSLTLDPSAAPQSATATAWQESCAARHARWRFT